MKDRLALLLYDLKEAPVFLVHYLVGLIALPFQQVEFTTLLILAILVGVTTASVLIGLIVFFAGYLALRTFDSLVGVLFNLGARRG